MSWNLPSPSDFDQWIGLLVEGEEPSQAAKSLGFTGSAFRRSDPVMHAECIAISREARGHFADEKAEEWALDEQADHRMRELWLRRWQPAYRQGDSREITVHGNVEVTHERRLTLA